MKLITKTELGASIISGDPGLSNTEPKKKFNHDEWDAVTL